MTSFKKVLHSLSKGFTSSFPISLAEERGQSIRTRTFVRGKGKKDSLDISLGRNGAKISVVFSSNDRRKQVIKIIREWKGVVIVARMEKIFIEL